MAAGGQPSPPSNSFRSQLHTAATSRHYPVGDAARNHAHNASSQETRRTKSPHPARELHRPLKSHTASPPAVQTLASRLPTHCPDSPARTHATWLRDTSRETLSSGPPK